MRTLLAGMALALTLTGCYGKSAPSYNPGDASQLVQEFTRRGITITATVSGDSACSDPSLVNNALHLRVTDPAKNAPRDIYIYAFRAKSWDESKAQVDACQASFAGAHAAASIERLDVPIYRVLGADWSSQLRSAVVAAITEASRAGTPP